jgi:hypothetical protein
MRKIERPLTVDKVGMLMHMAEYFLSQVVEMLAHIAIAPTSATPSPLYERSERAYKLAQQALDALTGCELSESETDRWTFRLKNLRNLRGGPKIKLQYAYCLEGRMPYSPIKFVDLPREVRDAFSGDENGYLPSSYNWEELVAKSVGWDANGTYNVIDIVRSVPRRLHVSSKSTQ